MSPLHYAFLKSQNNESIPLALLERGYAIDGDDEDGRTVLHQAACRADAAMIRLAIRRDALKEAKDQGWLTPLLIAVKEDHKNHECKAVTDAIETLLESNCDYKAKDGNGWMILHHAAHNSASLHSSPKASAIAYAILETLLERLPHTVLEARDKGGYTPLLQVAGSGDTEQWACSSTLEPKLKRATTLIALRCISPCTKNPTFQICPCHQTSLWQRGHRRRGRAQ
jgi:ankyrin repeat protein